MATLTVGTVTRAGLALAGSAATVTAGDAFPNTGKEFLVVKNSSLASINVTIKVQRKVDGFAATDRVEAVPAGEEQVFGPFPPLDYNDTNGRVVAICSAVADVTVQAISCPGA